MTSFRLQAPISKLVISRNSCCGSRCPLNLTIARARQLAQHQSPGHTVQARLLLYPLRILPKPITETFSSQSSVPVRSSGSQVPSKSVASPHSAQTLVISGPPRPAETSKGARPPLSTPLGQHLAPVSSLRRSIFLGLPLDNSPLLNQLRPYRHIQLPLTYTDNRRFGTAAFMPSLEEPRAPQ